MNLLFKYFARQIVVDAHPSLFTFTCLKDNFTLSIATFVYIDNSRAKSFFIAIGEEVPSNYLLAKPDIYRINVFDLDVPLPPKTTLSRESLIQVIFEYGFGKAYENDILPKLRPIAFILGADRFNNYFSNPRNELRILAKHGGAKEVIFDKSEL